MVWAFAAQKILSKHNSLLSYLDDYGNPWKKFLNFNTPPEHGPKISSAIWSALSCVYVNNGVYAS